jgi:4-amino-4-deoxy-L-arabinose transferase-like glycosyltransferase
MTDADASRSGAAEVSPTGPRAVAWREIAALALLAVVYLALVAYQVRWHPNEDYDEYIFMDVGRQILDVGQPIRTYDIEAPEPFFDHTPLYVYWVAAITALGGPSLTLVRLTTAGFGLLTVLGVYVAGRQVRGPASGFVGALVVATNPFFAFYSWFVRMEVPLACVLVLATIALVRGRALSAGLTIAIAVLLKEIALAFWLVATAWMLARHRLRDAALVAAPALVALVAWLAYAAALNGGQLADTLKRWYQSATGGEPDPRLKVRRLAWVGIIVDRIIGDTGLVALAAAAPLAALERRRIPAITAVPVGYVLIAVGSSFLIRLKEPRYLIAIVPMLALSIAFAVDWGDVWRRVRRATPAEDRAAG